MKKLLIGLIVLGTACSPRPPAKELPPVVVRPSSPVVLQENKVPGTVEGDYMEPMFDTVQVPAQIDPKGTYYRPSHKTVVEIIPGRVGEVQYEGGR